MQNLLIIKNDRVIVQANETVYDESLENFITDGGENLPEGVEEIDYNKTNKSCWINGKAFQDFPNAFAERVLTLVESLNSNKEKRLEAERIANMTEEENNAQIQTQLTAAVQKVLDDEAKKLNYDSCLSVCSYVDTGVQKFDDEGRAFRAWRSSVWAKGYEILAQVQAGERSIPTEDELIAELPALTIAYS